MRPYFKFLYYVSIFIGPVFQGSGYAQKVTPYNLDCILADKLSLLNVAARGRTSFSCRSAISEARVSWVSVERLMLSSWYLLHCLSSGCDALPWKPSYNGVLFICVFLNYHLGTLSVIFSKHSELKTNSNLWNSRKMTKIREIEPFFVYTSDVISSRYLGT